MVHGDTERSLVDALQAGRRASDELRELIETRCRHYKGLSFEDREELVQECFLRVWERLSEISDDSDDRELSRVISRVLSNLVRSHRRERKRYVRIADLEQILLVSERREAQLQPEELDETIRRLRLRGKERLLFYLLYEVGGDLRRIAVWLDVSYDCVCKRSERLRKKIRRRFGGGGECPSCPLLTPEQGSTTLRGRTEPSRGEIAARGRHGRRVGRKRQTL